MSARNTTVADESLEGFILVDSSLKPIFVNPAAASILSYPQKAGAQRNLEGFLVGKIHSTLLSAKSSRGPKFVAKFQSGKRVYLCHAFRVNALARANSRPSIAILLARGPKRSVSLVQVSERFRITTREQQVFQFLMGGLTTKEIATRMGVSPNTVKAFLRLIMMKMGVSTRSGILGKAFTTSE
jgi:DNA-binding CsgD family transcriptional regulator